LNRPSCQHSCPAQQHPAPAESPAAGRPWRLPWSCAWALYLKSDLSYGIRRQPILVTQTHAQSIGESHVNRLTAAWCLTFLHGTAKAMAGKWRVAPLPQWSAGESVSGNTSSSTSAVVRSSKHRAAAAAFAQFLNSYPASTKMPASKQSLLATGAVLGRRDDFDAYPDVSGICGGAWQGPVFVRTHHPDDAQPATGVTRSCRYTLTNGKQPAQTSMARDQASMA
jgi:hypothetical protein